MIGSLSVPISHSMSLVPGRSRSRGWLSGCRAVLAFWAPERCRQAGRPIKRGLRVTQWRPGRSPAPGAEGRRRARARLRCRVRVAEHSLHSESTKGWPSRGAARLGRLEPCRAVPRLACAACRLAVVRARDGRAAGASTRDVHLCQAAALTVVRRRGDQAWWSGP